MIILEKNNLSKKGIKGLKMNSISKLINDILDGDKKELLDKIINNKNLQNLLKTTKKLNDIFKDNNNKIKKEIFEMMKLFYFMNVLSNIKRNIDNRFTEEAFKKLIKFYEYRIKNDSFNKWKEIIILNNILQNLKIKKKRQTENNKSILSKAFLTWKTKKDIKRIIDFLKQNKIKKNILSNLIEILSKLKDKIDCNNIRETFGILKKLKETNKIKKQQ